jgi:hypothetical protein
MLNKSVLRAAGAISIFAIVIAVVWISEYLSGKREFTSWSKSQDGKVEQYAAFIQTSGVSDVVPLEQLLVSARERARCPGLRHEVPPPAVWSNIVPTLQLIQSLKDHGLLKLRTATSGYRSPLSNECSGGAKGSIHLKNNAIDLELDSSADSTRLLCEFWRIHGGALKFGLGFYETQLIHIDTSGHRTWGYDYTSKTSLCKSIQP